MSEPLPRPDSSRWLDAGSPWPWIAVALLAIVPHLSVLTNPFAYDDWQIIPQNPYMHHPQALKKMFSGNVWDFVGRTGVSNFYRPLMHVFNYAVFRAFGAQPGWYHLFCLALHAGVSLLVMALVRRFTGRHATGVLAGLLFAVHPIHSEVVAWIACSPELLSSFFSLLAILLYLRAVESRGAARAVQLLAMAASLLAAQFSKEIGVMTPVVIVAWETLARRRSPLRQWTERRMEYITLGAATCIYLAARVYALGGLAPVRHETGITWSGHLWTAVALFYRYLALLVWPVHLNFFRYHKPSHSPLDPAVAAGLVSIAAFFALGFWLYRRRAPEVLALPIWFFTLLPIFQLPYLAIERLVFERAAYLPSVGFCWLTAAGFVWLAERFPARMRPPAGGFIARPAWLLAVVVLVAYTARSATRINDWRDEATLLRDSLVLTPNFSDLHLARADVMLRADQPAEAVASLRIAIQLRPDYPDAYNSIGQAYWRLNQHELAIRSYRRAAELFMREGLPEFASRVWSNMGVAYRSLGDNRQAIQAYREALRLDPEFAQARNNLAYALLLEGRVDEAIAELQTTLRQDPAMWQASANLGLAYAMQEQWAPALAALADAERLSPGSPEVQARIGEVHLARGEFQAAHQRFSRALRLSPRHERALAGMAALREAGRTR